MDIEETAVRKLLSLLNPLHGSIDEQIANAEPGGDRHEIEITDKMEMELNEAVLILESRLPGSPLLEYPQVMTPPLRDILGMMVFELSPMAHAFREAGFQIERKAEAEQAFILDWLIKTALRHGDDWRKVAGERLGEIIEQAKAKNAAKEPAAS